MQDSFWEESGRSRRSMAHVADAGPNARRFECRCGWNSGWIFDPMTVSEVKRGIPCPICNAK